MNRSRRIVSLVLVAGSLSIGRVFGGHDAGRSLQDAGKVDGTRTPERIWNELLAGNQRFMQDRPARTNIIALRKELARGQKPEVIILGCSDSRLSPEILFDQTLGSLFVVRSAGNIADAIGVGSMEYAVAHLGARVLVVLGHEKCGAVAAACEHEPMPTPNLEAIVTKIKSSFSGMDQQFNVQEMKSLGVQANIYQSARDIVAMSPILKTAVEKGQLKIYTALYHLESGEVQPLP